MLLLSPNDLTSRFLNYLYFLFYFNYSIFSKNKIIKGFKQVFYVWQAWCLFCRLITQILWLRGDKSHLNSVQKGQITKVSCQIYQTALYNNCFFVFNLIIYLSIYKCEFNTTIIIKIMQIEIRPIPKWIGVVMIYLWLTTVDW